MYCTTFPCHNCAKHIIDAGIRRVVYLEPYDKSLARELHSDAIMNPLLDDEKDKIPFDAFGGVAPRRYSQLFGINRERKDDTTGRYIDQDHKRNKLCPVGTQNEDVIYQKIEKAAKLLTAADKTTGTADNEE